MALNKRGKTWQYFIQINGKVFRGSCKTENREEALEFHDRKRAELWRCGVVKDRKRYTWTETLDRWMLEHEHKKSIRDDARYAEWWTTEFARYRARYLDQITPDLVKEIRDNELGRRHLNDVHVERYIKPATVNKKLSFLRSVMNAAAREYLWIDTTPIFKGYTEHNERVRYLEPHEFVRLISFMPESYANLATFAVSTGLRLGNQTGLSWKHVNLVRRTVTFPDTVMKNGLPLTIPLNETALNAVKRQIGKHDVWVFPRSDGQRILGIPQKMWVKAKKSAGIENFLWHDLRHTWASWLRQTGNVGLDLIQELGGWKSRQMVQRYSHLSVEHLAQSASVLDGILGSQKEFTTQKLHTLEKVS